MQSGSDLSQRNSMSAQTIGCIVAAVFSVLAIGCSALFAAWAVFIYQPPASNTSFRPTPYPTVTPKPASQQPTTPSPPPTDTPQVNVTPVGDPPATATPIPAPTNTPAAVENPTEAPQPTKASPPPATVPAKRPWTGKMASPDYGMQVFLWWEKEIADRDLKLVEEAGFRWVKQQFAWREIEGQGKGKFDWERADRVVNQVEAHGLDLIARVDAQPEWAGGGFPELGPPNNYQDYADFVYALASRYKGRIRIYQIWNEPNLSREWGNRPPNPTEYTQLLKLGYEAVKKADPEAIVISAGLAPTSRWDNVAMPDVEFIKGMYAAGAKPYFDALGVHGAGYKVAPETDPAVVAKDPALHNNDPSPEELKRIYCFRHVEDVRKVMVDNGDADKQIVLLEFGWTTDPRPDSPYHWHAVSEVDQANYLVRAYQYAKEHWQPWIGVMSLIYMPSPQWGIDDEQTYWCIVYPRYPELWIRPAYEALKKMPK
jgi:hypothetical protein